MKYCSTCNLEYPDTSGFCKMCGGGLAARGAAGLSDPCPACGAAVLGGWKFCKQCGHTLDETTVVRARGAAPLRARADGPAPAQAATLDPPPPTFDTPPHVVTTTPIPAAATTQVPAAAEAPEEQCKACGYWNDASAGACAACGAAVGARARKRRVKRVVMAVSVLLVALALLAAAGAAAWYMAGVGVAIQTDPGDSKIVIDGEDVGSTNSFGALMTRRFRAGDHTLSVTHEGFDTWRQDFNIALTDLGKSLNVKLNPTKYKLTVVATPPGSEVLVDNVSAGTVNGSGHLETEPLTPGAHTVVVRADGYRDWKQSVSVKADTRVEVTLSVAPVVDEDSSSSEGDMRTALDGWAQSIHNRDIDAHMRYYADTLDYYYGRSTAPSSKVRDDRAKAFQKFNWLSVQLSNFNIQLDSTGQRATVLFDKTFDFRSDGGSFFTGSVQNQLTLTKLGGAWLITGEKELKVYDVKSSPGT
jgi:type 1 fimbria pilin